jgi:hypothetical protein
MKKRGRVLLFAVGLVAAGPVSVIPQQADIAAVPRTLVSSRATVTKAGISKLRNDALTTIQGNALSSTNGALSDVVVRLRDARFGRIVDTEMTDKSGLFSFKSIDPGTYIVEVMANNDSVLAASQLLNVNAGEAVSAVVKLPFRIPPFATVLGTTNTQSAAAVLTQAAVSSIAAVVPTVPISPEQ